MKAGKTMKSDNTLKDLLERRIAGCELHADFDPECFFGGNDWWELMKEEEVVFRIQRKRWPRMLLTWEWFEDFIQRTHLSTLCKEADAVLASERARRSDLMKLGFTFDGFARFAKDYGSLTQREVHALFQKQMFWEVRQGLAVYADEQNNNTHGDPKRPRANPKRGKR